MTLYPPGQSVVGLFGEGELGSVYTHWATRWLLGNSSQGLSPFLRKRLARVVASPAVTALLPENLRPLDPSVGGWKVEQTWYPTWSAVRPERPDEQPAALVRAITPRVARSNPRRAKNVRLTGGSELGMPVQTARSVPLSSHHGGSCQSMQIDRYRNASGAPMSPIVREPKVA